MKRHFVVPTLLAVFAVGLLVAPTFAQQRPGPGGFQFGGGAGGGLAGILQRSDVADELELTADQKQDLEALTASIRTRTQEAMAGLRDGEGSREERFAAIREAMQSVTEETEKEVGKILLPHQVKRAKQLQTQLRLQGGATRALTGGALADELGISEEQREKIRARAEEVEQELRQQLVKLRAEAQEKLLAELTPEQRAKYKETVGEPFEFQRTAPEGTRFGGGGAFGRGGDGRSGFQGRRGGDAARGEGRPDFQRRRGAGRPEEN